MEKTPYRKLVLDASKAIADNTALFYQQKQKDGYDMLDCTLTLLVQATNKILDSQLENNELIMDQGKLNEVLSSAMNAIEGGDTILLSDILYFDLKPLLDQSL